MHMPLAKRTGLVAAPHDAPVMAPVDALPWSACPADARAAARPGRVTLVGAGPGDPDLLTVKAWRAIRAARLVLHDQLVGEGVMALLHPHCERIDVGKRCGAHAMPQAQICARLVALAQAGRDVLRLKGGDPFIFGRGGEELQALRAAGLPVSVIPGISAAQGAAAALGLPLTQRGHAATLVLTTGHRREDAAGADEPAPDWAALARPGQTVVFYMGLGALAELCAQLIAHGRSPATPAALVERATQADQRCTAGTLADLPARAAAAGVRAPALIIVGEVVALRAPQAAAAAPAPGWLRAGGAGG